MTIPNTEAGFASRWSNNSRVYFGRPAGANDGALLLNATSSTTILTSHLSFYQGVLSGGLKLGYNGTSSASSVPMFGFGDGTTNFIGFAVSSAGVTGEVISASVTIIPPSVLCQPLDLAFHNFTIVWQYVRQNNGQYYPNVQFYCDSTTPNANYTLIPSALFSTTVPISAFANPNAATSFALLIDWISYNQLGVEHRPSTSTFITTQSSTLFSLTSVAGTTTISVSTVQTTTTSATTAQVYVATNYQTQTLTSQSVILQYVTATETSTTFKEIGQLTTTFESTTSTSTVVNPAAVTITVSTVSTTQTAVSQTTKQSILGGYTEEQLAWGIIGIIGLGVLWRGKLFYEARRLSQGKGITVPNPEEKPGSTGTQNEIQKKNRDTDPTTGASMEPSTKLPKKLRRQAKYRNGGGSEQESSSPSFADIASKALLDDSV